MPPTETPTPSLHTGSPYAMFWFHAWALGLLALLPNLALPQQSSVSPSQSVLVYVVRPTMDPINVDGVVTPEEWKPALPVAGLRTLQARRLVRNQTLFRLLYDYEALYLSALCYEQQLDQIVAEPRERDGEVLADDAVEWVLPNAVEGQPEVQMAVNALGVQLDAVGSDRTWNADWTATTGRADIAWSLEAKIPFAALGREMPSPFDLWAFNIIRHRRAGAQQPEFTTWAPIVEGNRLAFGRLVFVQLPIPPEISPFATIGERLGVPARVFGDSGYVDLASGEVLLVQYSDMLRSLLDEQTETERRLERLALAFEKAPEHEAAARYYRLSRTWDKLSRDIRRAKAISAVAWVWGTLDIQETADQIAALYEEARQAGFLATD